MTAVGLGINEIATIISSMFVESLFGSYILVGLAVLAIVYVWISGSSTHTEGILLVGFSALILFFSGFGIYTGGYLPSWTGVIVIIFIAMIVATAFLKQIGAKR